MFDVKQEAMAMQAYITEERHYLHAHPELGTKEVNTTRHIAAELQKMGIEVITFKDITGAIGVLKGAQPGKTVVLRADIDALPIQENKHGQSYISQNPGVMHACGHDCHTAMLLGAAKILSAHREEIHGTVKFLFQMAEEIGTESRHYVENGSLDDADAIYGMHIWSLMDSGTFNLEDGERMACSDRITIKVKGEACHGSAPQDGKDAIVAASAIVMGLQTIVSRTNDPQNSLVVTVGAMNGGQQTNVLAEEVELVGTVRTFNKEFRKQVPKLIEQKAENIAKAYGCEVECIYFFGPAPLINDHKELNNYARAAVTQIMGDKALIHLDKQMGAEDFSVYMDKVPGVFGFLGCGNKDKGICCVHHHPDFEVDEDVFPYGTGIYVQFALNFLGSKI